MTRMMTSEQKAQKETKLRAQKKCRDFWDIFLPSSKLPADTLAALQDFHREKDARQKQFEDLKTAAEDDFAQLSIHTLFAEDWNASQFWV